MSNGKVNMRDQMPLTSEWVNRQRTIYGADHVNDCIRRALKGEPGRFWAMEGGHVLGTPAAVGDPMAQWQHYARGSKVQFAAFLATPTGGMTNGAQ